MTAHMPDSNKYITWAAGFHKRRTAVLYSLCFGQSPYKFQDYVHASASVSKPPIFKITCNITRVITRKPFDDTIWAAIEWGVTQLPHARLQLANHLWALVSAYLICHRNVVYDQRLLYMLWNSDVSRLSHSSVVWIVALARKITFVLYFINKKNLLHNIFDYQRTTLAG